MKNRLSDLNNHLFAQLERLSDETLSLEEIEKEVQRAEAVVAVSDTIIANAGLQLKAVALMADHGGRMKLPAMLALDASTETKPAERTQ